jgi:hypothetical protein
LGKTKIKGDNMYINMNNEKGEMIFSWKEIWILIKKRKLTFSQDFLDQLIVSLLKIKAESNKKNNIKKTNE